jgi:hypothetical protein
MFHNQSRSLFMRTILKNTGPTVIRGNPARAAGAGLKVPPACARAAAWAVVAGGLLLAAQGMQGATNSLANAGFEAGIAGWSPYLNWAIESTNNNVFGSSPAKPVTVHGGTNAFKTWGGYQTYTTYCGAYQDVPAAPDSTWAADCWASTQTPDDLKPAGTAGNQCWLEVSFRNGTTPNTPLLTYTSNVIDTNSTPNAWLHLVVGDGLGGTNLLAPAGTTFVRCQIVFRQPPGYPGGSVYLDDATLLKTSAPDPEITAQPVSQTRVVSQSVTFNVLADGKSSLSYQWYRDFLPLSNDSRIHGVTTATLTVSNLVAADQAYYSVRVTDNAGPLDSEPAYLTILDPGLLVSPVSQTIVEGQSVSFTAVAAGETPLTYRWQRAGTNLVDGGNVSGATTTNLTLANVTVTDAGTYAIEATDTAGVTNTPVQLKVVPLAQLATNVLINPGFEDGVASLPWEQAWQRFGGGDIQTTNNFYYNSSVPVSVWDGTYVSRTWAGDEWNGLFQDRPASAGQVYTASGWFLPPAEDAIAGANVCYLEVQFRTASDGVLAQYSSYQIRTNFPLNTWINLQPTNHYAGDFSTFLGTASYLVAPAGTAKVRYQVTYHALGGGGSVYYDDMNLRLREPVVTATQSGAQIKLSFATLLGPTYQVLYKTNLTDSTWQPLTTVTGDGTTKSVLDSLGSARRFYTVNTQ